MIPTQFESIANHLWQSTLFAAVAGLTNLALKKNAARTRYWVWFAASAKFLVPFSILVIAGSHFGRSATLAVPNAPPITHFIEQVSHPFAQSLPAAVVPSARATRSSFIATVLPFAWAIGFVFVIFFWWRRVRIHRAMFAGASPLDLPIGVKVMSSNATLEPGVFGVWRPVLLLPEGIMSHLTALELEAILAHELCHVRRRDNFVAVIHMAVEALFWFHPLVWWLGARLMEERENGCDEEVVRGGVEPQVYAEGILKVCELYLASPLPCVSGVTGSNLKKRIEAIMSNRIVIKLSITKKIVLTVTGLAALAGPIIDGFVNAPLVHAQPPQLVSEFEVASIKPSNGGSRPIDAVQLNFGMEIARGSSGGRFVTALPLKFLIQLAYGVKEAQILGAPSWANSDLYRIDARASGDAAFEQMRPMLQSLLADRFKLRLSHETRVMAVYDLTVAKGGRMFEPAKEGSCLTPDPKGPLPPLESKICGGVMRGMSGVGPEQRDSIQAFGISMPKLVDLLSDVVGRTVLDKTGLTGMFNVQLEFVPDQPQGARALGAATAGPSSSFSGPSIFTALRDQLGLRLEASKGPVEAMVIDHVEKPSAN